MLRTSLIASSVTLLSLCACSVAPGGEIGQSGGALTEGPRNDADDGDAAESSDGGPGVDTLEVLDIGGVPGEDICGDGVLTTEEACDDGNTEDGDGCSADCKFVAEGYSCNPPGQPCRQVALCGDGLVNAPELCDDGNRDPGDGCSDSCKVEVGFKCEGIPTSVCTATVCGDGVQEGAESCDDGNTIPGDGCNELCQAEPTCPASGACTSECGDGLVLGEMCDDGNLIDGDGCSSTCTIEAGFTCEQSQQCEMIGDECILRVYATYRDFLASHPDFELADGAPCVTDGEEPISAATKATQGLVADMLNEQGKPVWQGTQACSSAETFPQWYTDVPGVNQSVSRSIPLFPNGEGGFVNRYGEMGEQLSRIEWQDNWAANSLAECETMGIADCVLCDYNFDGVPEADGSACTRTITVEEYYDGTPLFFPIDDMGTDAKYTAVIPPSYGLNWQPESALTGMETLHNFHFTSEISYWFIFDPNVTMNLAFTGDDDVWVFVNGHLAVDLGGVHVPIDGQVTIDATTGPTFGLEAGQGYRIKIFHAERKIEGSSFRLTLTGFNTARSECRPECGDGIVGLGEECDDGINDGGYGECGEGCRLDTYCGDGIIQEDAGENCDDGNFFDDDECPASCRIVNVG